MAVKDTKKKTSSRKNSAKNNTKSNAKNSAVKNNRKNNTKNNTVKSKKIRNKEPIKGLMIGLAATAAFYILATMFFSSHFFPRTVINGYSCQFKTVNQVKEMIEKGCKEYELILEEREEKQEKLTSDQVVLQFVDDGKIEKIKEEQKSYGWIKAIFRKPVYENAVTIVYNEDAFSKTIDSLECLKQDNMKAPEAAYPAYRAENGKFEIVEEKLGTLVEIEKLTEEIRNALLSDQRILNLSDAGCYVKPAFYSSDTAIIEAADKMNGYLATEIIYDMGYTEVAVEKEQMAKWLTTDEQANVIVAADKVGDYVDWLGRNYNTCGIPRKFNTPENTTITISGGTYGWRIHFQKEVEQLCLDVTTGEKIKREPIYRQTAYRRDENGNDLHNTYVAISINAQTLWYYKDGQCLLTTPVVTGNTSKNMGTPTGVYDIAFKQRDHVLRGEDYESPVDYWLPFYEYRGIGIHDASWRAADAFGGVIYQGNGSHGCVNTPYEAVKTLYELVKTGTPVVVY